MKHTDPTFIKQTMDKLNSVKPVSQRRVMLRNGLLAFVLLVLSFASAWLISSYFYDMYQTLYTGYNPFRLGVFRIGDTLLELLLLASILLSACYLLYRKTDWPLVRRRATLVCAILAVIGILGGTLTSFASDDFLSSPPAAILDLPYRKARRMLVQSRLRQYNVAIGKVASISNESVSISSVLGLETFMITEESQIHSQVDKGDIVVIRFHIKDSAIEDTKMVKSMNKTTKRRAYRAIVRRLW